MSSTNKGILPHVVLLTCGGTIAALPAEGVGYQAGLLPPERLLEAIPNVGNAVRVTVEPHADIGSQDVDHSLWSSLGRRVRELGEDPAVDGIVITHGTDTLEETAYFLHLVTKPAKPVVLTGAMRPAHALGADGPANLQAGIYLAGSRVAQANGVVVVMNDMIHGAEEVQKNSADALDAFSGRNYGPLGRMNGEFPILSDLSRTSLSEGYFSGIDLNTWPKVPLLYVHAGMEPDWLEALLSTRPDGLVVAGVGNGNAPLAVWRRLASAVAQGLIVVRSSRCAGGFVDRGVEVDDDSYGFLASGGLNPQKARILLMCSLQQNSGPDVAKAIFNDLTS